jgi:2,4-dienoyl-CoA reductase-like NADH-dependent reductase (Old Yellow Enzyme family)
MPGLFSPFEIGALRLDNRIVVSPMCQYSAVDGSADDWHLMHLGQFAAAGPGLIVLEATAVEARGRITHGCLGLYSDANEAALRRVVDFMRRTGPSKIGIQLAHAGRKASAQKPWDGGGALGADAAPWPTIGPSASAHDTGWHVPAAMTPSDIAALRENFVASARRAARLGFDFVELHMAHGYLLHQFLSPLANARTDAYGGSRENRMRLAIELTRAVRAALPDGIVLGARLSVSDWVDGGWTLDDSIALTRLLAAEGCQIVDASSGGVSPAQKIPLGPGYQVHFAEAIRQATGIPTMAVGMITEPAQADEIVASGRADLVALARAFLRDPHWVWNAAETLGGAAYHAPQYLRAARAARARR